MHGKLLMIASLSGLLSVTTLVQADDHRLPAERLDDILARATAFGFQAFSEIEAQRDGRFDVEGWLDDEWYAEVRFLPEEGEITREERRRREGGAWGMRENEVREAMALAVAEGLVEFEQVQFDRDGRIEIDGRDADGRDLEIETRGAEVLKVEFD